MEIIISKKVSSVREHRTRAITCDLMRTDLVSLDEIKQGLAEFITRHPDKIPEIKSDPEKLKAFENFKLRQTLISEFYKEDWDGKSYRHVKDECDTISSIIIDIDSTISLSDFTKEYGDYHFIAYPSISNTDPKNWKKYRVIFPLANEVKVPNDSLLTLKLLRNSICPYEDGNHQLGSYINREQWDMRVENDGVEWDISQQKVNYFHNAVTTAKDFSKKKINKRTGRITGCTWSVGEAVSYYEKYDMDDHRHRATYIIKMNLNDEDRKRFRDWMVKNHPDKVHHFDSHKV